MHHRSTSKQHFKTLHNVSYEEFSEIVVQARRYLRNRCIKKIILFIYYIIDLRSKNEKDLLAVKVENVWTRQIGVTKG